MRKRVHLYLTMSKIDLLKIEKSCNLSISCCILLSDILLMEYVCARYVVVLNEELCQYLYNQIRMLVLKVKDVIKRVEEVNNGHIDLARRILKYCILLDDVRSLLHNALLRSYSSPYLLSIVLLTSNLLRMIRSCIEDLYSSLVTTFDKHTKFID